VPLSAVISQTGASEPDPATGSSEGPSTGDPVHDLAQAAIIRAREAAAAGRTPAFATEQPSRRREQLRDGRNLL
jgi:hypothetical protein